MPASTRKPRSNAAAAAAAADRVQRRRVHKPLCPLYSDGAAPLCTCKPARADRPLDVVERARELWPPGKVSPSSVVGNLVLDMIKEIERLREAAPPPVTAAPTTIAAARELLEKRRTAVGAERDALRELQDDVEELITSCDEAVEGLDTAIDALSRYA